jgi:hypothetical protein
VTPLTLHEEVLLLTLRDKEGVAHMGLPYQFVLGGALTAELLLNGRIAVEEEKRKKFVKLVSKERFDDPVLDECLEKLETAKRWVTLQTWITRFAQIKQLKHRIAQRLCERGVLKMSEDKVLLLFTRKIYPERDPKPEREIVARLKQAIFTYTTEIDPRTVVLISLTNRSGVLAKVFDKKKLKGRKRRLEQITKGNVLGEATREVIQAVQAAVMISTVATTVAATSAR